MDMVINMKTILTFILLVLSFAVTANDKLCSKGRMAYYGELQKNSGFQRLCYVPETGKWYFGVKPNDTPTFSDMEVSLINKFSQTVDNVKIEGFEIRLDLETVVVLGTNIVNGKMDSGYSMVNQVTMRFVPSTILVNYGVTK